MNLINISKNLIQQLKRSTSTFANVNVLGIETSCDDTGIAIVNGVGRILGQALISQANKSVQFGGVVPTIAKKYHEKNIVKAVNEAFHQSNIEPNMISAVAATVKPGNSCTLKVGAEFGKNFALQHCIPFIPIHHMEAHALTVRLNHEVEFPFVVLLVSGGHCILTLAQSLSEWLVVGETVDISPGNLLDQLARRLKLKNLPEVRGLIGGKAIETLAKNGDPRRFPCPSPMSQHRNANFSFSGLFSHFINLVNRLEQQQGIEGGRVLDLQEICDLCASLQYSLTKHLIRQTHKGLQFLDMTRLIGQKNKALVLSGGVASNAFLREAFEKLCGVTGFDLVVPAPHLCTDNGVMIAWNGVERWKVNHGIITHADLIRNIDVQHKCPLGENISSEHTEMNLKNPKWVKI